MALALVLGSVFGLRLIWEGSVADRTIEIPSVPFTSFPLEIAGPEWKVEEVPLPEGERQTAGVSDYMQRHYTKGDLEIWFYVGFVGSGETGAIHSPEYCLPASGYDLRESTAITLDLPGLDRPTRWRENLWTDSRSVPVYSLYTLYYKGAFEPEEWRLRARRVLGVPYFVAISVTGDYMGSLEETRRYYAGLLERAVPLLLRHLP